MPPSLNILSVQWSQTDFFFLRTQSNLSREAVVRFRSHLVEPLLMDVLLVDKNTDVKLTKWTAQYALSKRYFRYGGFKVQKQLRLKSPKRKRADISNRTKVIVNC